MPIPLRELAVIMMLVPFARGLEFACQSACVQWDALAVGQTWPDQHSSLRATMDKRSSCNEESMLMAWDVLLQMQAEAGRHDTPPPRDKVAYESASL